MRPEARFWGCLALWAALLVAQAAWPPSALEGFQGLPAQPPRSTYSFVDALPGVTLNQPVATATPPGETGRLFVVEKTGRIVVITNLARPTRTVFANLTTNLLTSGEQGLLGLAFHPRYAENRRLFVFRTLNTGPDGTRQAYNVLTEFRASSSDPNAIDPASEVRLFAQRDEASNHNGGTVVFGPDGFAYLSIGDGGAANDPHHYAQNLGSLLGKVIRIDVSRKGDKGEPYAVPADNPFVGREGALPEIWASGTRNIWRMAFDPKTGDLWAGDVGQNIYEEVSLIKRGGNYGWNAREGFHAFRGGKGEGPFEEPIVEYHHREGLSITGGQVYRGKAIPALDGVYIYADFVSSNVWGIRMIDGKPTEPAIIAQKRGELIASIDAMHDGTLVVSAFTGGQDRGNPGTLWKLVEAPK